MGSLEPAESRRLSPPCSGPGPPGPGCAQAGWPLPPVAGPPPSRFAALGPGLGAAFGHVYQSPFVGLSGGGVLLNLSLAPRT